MGFLKKLPTMPGALTLILVWTLVWVFVSAKDAAQALCGKGLAQIGNEYWRLLTAGWTHASIVHLLANASAMFWVGYLYEQRVGSIRLLTVGMLCAVAAQTAFLSLYRNTACSIGGSGYVFALCGFCFVLPRVSPGFPQLPLGTWGGNWLAVYLVASNVPGLIAADPSVLVLHSMAFALGLAGGLGCGVLGR